MSLTRLEIINLDTTTQEAKNIFAAAVLAVTCTNDGKAQLAGIQLHNMSGESISITCTPDHHTRIAQALHGTPENPVPFQVLAR